MHRASVQLFDCHHGVWPTVPAECPYQLTALGAGAQHQRRHSTAFSSKCRQCYVDSRVDEAEHRPVCCCSDVSDDVVLHVVQLMLRLSTSSAAIQTTTDELLLVCAQLVSSSLLGHVTYRECCCYRCSIVRCCACLSLC